MFRTILFPTDFSAQAERAMDCLSALKSTGVEEVVLVHAIDTQPAMDVDGLGLGVLERWQEEAEHKLGEAAGRLKAEGLIVKRLLKTGPPSLAIVEAALENGVSLIVIGSHGKGYIEEMLLGSTTEEVLRRSPIPVLVEKFRSVEAAGKGAWKLVSQKLFTKILYPTDFSQTAEHVQDLIKHLKGVGAEEVIVLHVQDFNGLRRYLPKRVDEVSQLNSGRLEAIRGELEAAGLKVKTVLREGPPFQEIMKVADEEGVSLIAMGSTGRSMVDEALIGSVSGKVVRMAAQPVLLVK